MNSKYKNILGVIGVVLITLVINKFSIFIAYIPSSSMVPTLNPGNRIIATRVYKPSNLKRGDIVIFKSDELKETLIKRLIGLPGDEIKFEGTSVYVNGEKIEEPYIKNNMDFEGEYKVPEGRYFFLGDNRSNSYDSRFWKEPYIKGNTIIGKAQFKIWPLKDIGFLK
ncbi:signal peptidase I [Clostridium baratii]|uniref:signal peptidase I n=1 Tax=Clostridium baratii TaxID=1561 RepID=UPI0030D2995A